MAQPPKKLSDTTRSERRRAAKLRNMSPREQRWRDVCLVVEAGLRVLNQYEDVLILAKFQDCIREVNKYLANSQSDEEIVMRCIRSGAWLVSEISEESGFPTLYVQKILKTLCQEGKVMKVNNMYQQADLYER